MFNLQMIDNLVQLALRIGLLSALKIPNTRSVTR
jgi:hypothetical protein